MASERKHMAKAGLGNEVSAPIGSRNFISDTSGTREMTPEMQASVVFDLSCIRTWGPGAGKQVAILLRVSPATVSRWRSPDHRELPSATQLIGLGPLFLRIYNSEQSKFYGFHKKALLELLQLAGELAQAAS